jgi:hypothetical protein
MKNNMDDDFEIRKAAAGRGWRHGVATPHHGKTVNANPLAARYHDPRINSFEHNVPHGLWKRDDVVPYHSRGLFRRDHPVFIEHERAYQRSMRGPADHRSSSASSSASASWEVVMTRAGPVNRKKRSHVVRDRERAKHAHASYQEWIGSNGATRARTATNASATRTFPAARSKA